MIVGKSDETGEFNGDNIYQEYSDDSNICNKKEIKHKDGIFIIHYTGRCNTYEEMIDENIVYA